MPFLNIADYSLAVFFIVGHIYNYNIIVRPVSSKITINKNEFARIVCTVALIPITSVVTGKIIGLVIESNSFIDIRLCNYLYVHSKEVLDVWAISEIDPNELVNCTFVEIRNIGETMVTRLKIIIDHDGNKGNPNYIIQYALKKNDIIYLAVSMKNDLFHKVENITVIDYAGRDTARNFYGKQPKVGKVQIFSRIKNAIENNTPIDKICYRVGLPPQTIVLGM